jgi:hypothetical protein
MKPNSLFSRINDFAIARYSVDLNTNRNDLSDSMVAEIAKAFTNDEKFQSYIGSVVYRFASEGLGIAVYLKAAIKRPQLFYQLPETIEGNIRNLVCRFAGEGLDTAAYLKAAVKQPSLFCQSPETVEGNLRNLVCRCAGEGLDIAAYLTAALNRHQQYKHPPVTTARNTRLLVCRFAGEGLDATAYLKAALKRPSLFYLSPETTESNIRNLACRFAGEGLDAAAYLKAAVKQPSLFYQSPETIGNHLVFILKMFRKGLFKFDNEADARARMAEVLKYPLLLSTGTRNRRLHQWWIMNSGTAGKYSYGSVMGKRKKDLLAEYYRKFPNHRRGLSRLDSL